MKELTDSVYAFADLRQGKYLYVDKTEYVWKLVRSYKGTSCRVPVGSASP